MKKKMEILIIIFLIIYLLLSGIYSSRPSIVSFSEDNWNNGKCELDGRRLHYIGTNDKEIYECEVCGKKYKFNKVMKYEGD